MITIPKDYWENMGVTQNSFYIIMRKLCQMVEIIINLQIIIFYDIMNEIYNTKIREANSSIARSSIKPIFQKISEKLIFLPSFLIFIQTVTLVIILNSIPRALRFAAFLDPQIIWEQHRLQILNYVIHIYLPMILICLILISIGLFLNLCKRLVIRLEQSKKVSDNDIRKRKIIVKERGTTYILQNNSKTVPYKPRFRLIHIPIVVFFIYTGILTLIGNSSGFNSDKTFNFIIQNYIPGILLCWIAFAVILLVTHLRKKLRNVEVKRF